jgi:hypothetical protein
MAAGAADAEKMAKRAEIARLAALFREQWPHDVLMPVKPGTKHPIFVFRHGSWTWAKFDKFLEGYAEEDVCVLLRDLIVVDVDSVEQARKLEERFPCLLEAPAERTRKGMHYFFARSVRADADGYYDGAGQRERGVDFKTVCRTGTGGVLVLAPSEGKAWVRDPWSASIEEIPDDLLDAVAVPHHRTLAARLAFCPESEEREELLVETPFLHLMKYFEPLTSGELGEREPFPVPCSRAAFEELLYAIEHDDLRPARATRALLRSVVEAADKLMLNARVTRRIRLGTPRRRVDAEEACAAWSDAHVAERAWRQGLAAGGDAVLLDVDEALSQATRYVPLPRDDRWLMHAPDGHHEALRASEPHAAARPPPPRAGEPVVRPRELDSGLIGTCVPAPVLAILRAYPGRIVLAGGAALALLSWHVRPGSDYDLFVVGMDEREATDALAHIRRDFMDGVGLGLGVGLHGVHRTRNAVTLTCGHGVTVQVVLRLHASLADVLLSFDVPPSKVAVYHDPARGGYAARCAPSWVPAMRHLAFPLDGANWGRAGVARTFKYQYKGFGVFLPGCRRVAVRAPSRDPPGTRSRRGPRAATRGVAGLFHVERELWKARGGRRWSCHAVQDAAELARVVGLCKYESDYALRVRLEGRLQYVARFLHAAYDFGRRLLSNRRVPGGSQEKGGGADEDVAWRACRPSAVMFHPADPQHLHAYDVDRLAQAYDAEDDVR